MTYSLTVLLASIKYNNNSVDHLLTRVYVRTLIKSYFEVMLLAVALMLITQSVSAKLPMLAHLADGRDLPKPYGINIDVLSMEQDYEIDRFQLGLPNFAAIDTSLIHIESETDYSALKLDAWIFPFLNAFVMFGKIDGSTSVSLERVQVPGLPVRFGNIDIDLDGDVLGGGLTAIVGDEKWFSSLTLSYSESDLDGDFSSNITTWSVMPRLGARFSKAQVWLTAMYLDIDENHSGRIDLGVQTPAGPLAPIPFDLSLQPTQSVNYGVGTRFDVTDNLSTTLELTFGDRKHQFLNLNWRY